MSICTHSYKQRELAFSALARIKQKIWVLHRKEKEIQIHRLSTDFLVLTYYVASLTKAVISTVCFMAGESEIFKS